MYLFVHLCTHVCMSVSLCVSLCECVCIPVLMCAYVCVHTCVSLRMCLCMSVRMCVYVCAYVCARMCLYVCAYVYVYVYAYAFACLYISTLWPIGDSAQPVGRSVGVRGACPNCPIGCCCCVATLRRKSSFTHNCSALSMCCRVVEWALLSFRRRTISTNDSRPILDCFYRRLLSSHGRAFRTGSLFVSPEKGRILTY